MTLACFGPVNVLELQGTNLCQAECQCEDCEEDERLLLHRSAGFNKTEAVCGDGCLVEQQIRTSSSNLFKASGKQNINSQGQAFPLLGPSL